MNWYKIAQAYNTVDWARNATDPEMLRIVLNRATKIRFIDDVVREAAVNPHCYPQDLAEIIINGPMLLAFYVAQNPRCPPEALAKVLRKKYLKEKQEQPNVLYMGIAASLNCPPEVLAEILERAKGDPVSIQAAKNPNCPPEALGKWLKNVRLRNEL